MAKSFFVFLARFPELVWSGPGQHKFIESIVGALRPFRWKAFYLRMLMLQWWVWSPDVIMCAVPFDDLI